MVDFRKLLLALIAGALIFGIAASAADFSCQVAGVPTLIRTEGVADYVGDVLMNCAGNLPQLLPVNGVVANIRLDLQPYTVTSKDLDTRANGPTSEATLILNNAIWPDGTPHVKGYMSTSPVLLPFPDGSQNIYQAVRLGNNEVEWQGVVLVGPGSAMPNAYVALSIRMTNVRVNAAGLGPNVPITAQVNIVTPTSIPIFGNVSVLVANTRVGMLDTQSPFTAKNCDLSTIPPGSFSFTSTFMEGFGTSFKPRYNNYPGFTPHWIPGGGYFDESGYNPIGFGNNIPTGGLDAGSSLVLPGSIGNASQGTRLSLTVTGIPNGLTLTTPGTITTANGLVLTALAMSPSSGTASTETLTWEVTGYASPGTAQFLVDTVAVVVTASYSAPPVVGTAIAHGRLVPDVNGYFTAVVESLAPVPRFVDSVAPNSVDGPVITITQNCKTLLLFPYLTSSAGYNSGIAISNASVDPLGNTSIVAGEIGYPTFPATKPQAGACTLWFYGQSSLTALTSGQINQTTVSIPAGGQFITNLAAGVLGGFVYGQDGSKVAACDGSITGNPCSAMPAYVGYMIAACNFQWAHGYAFVTDTGSDRTMGYLALVIPDRGAVIGRLPQESSFQAGPNQAEQLGQ